jgi:hypothetical protein
VALFAFRDVGAVSAINFHIILRVNGAFYGLYTYTENDDNDYLTVLTCSPPPKNLFLAAKHLFHAAKHLFPTAKHSPKAGCIKERPACQFPRQL